MALEMLGTSSGRRVRRSGRTATAKSVSPAKGQGALVVGKDGVGEGGGNGEDGVGGHTPTNTIPPLHPPSSNQPLDLVIATTAVATDPDPPKCNPSSSSNPKNAPSSLYCSICNHYLVRARVMAVHMAKHERGEKVAACPYCPSKFFVTSLSGHIQSKHSEKYDGRRRRRRAAEEEMW